MLRFQFCRSAQQHKHANHEFLPTSEDLHSNGATCEGKALDTSQVGIQELTSQFPQAPHQTPFQ
jgi:hypothetical protein